MVAEARTLYDRLDEPTFEQKWSVIEAITDHIVTGEGTWRFTVTMPPARAQPIVKTFNLFPSGSRK